MTDANVFYFKKIKKRVSRNKLARSGLLNSEIRKRLDIVKLVVEHEIDLELYTAQDVGEEIREDGKAYVLFEAEPMTAESPEAEMALKDTMKSKINALRNQIYEAGVPFEFSGTPYTLQTRNAYDLLNWTTALSRYQALPVSDAVQIRTAENVNVEMEAQQAVGLINAGVDARKAVMFVAAGVKDNIDAAADLAGAYAAYEAGLVSVSDAEPAPIQVS